MKFLKLLSGVIVVSRFMQCEEFLAACLAAGEPEEDCVGGGLLICNDVEVEFEPEPF